MSATTAKSESAGRLARELVWSEPGGDRIGSCLLMSGKAVGIRMTALKALQKRAGKNAVLDTCMARNLGGKMLTGTDSALAALRRDPAYRREAADRLRHDKELPDWAAAILEWYLDGEDGVSSEFMLWHCLDRPGQARRLVGIGHDYVPQPADAGDLYRCWRAWQALQADRPGTSLETMRRIAPVWAVLAENWPVIDRHCRALTQRQDGQRIPAEHEAALTAVLARMVELDFTPPEPTA